MLFNSAQFVLLFLPVTLIGFFVLGRLGLYRIALFWLVLASLFFYGFFRVDYLLLLCVLTVLNFGFGRVLQADFQRGTKRWWVLALGIVMNLGVLGYFKYTNFFVENVDALFDLGWVMQKVVLPIGISFFTFQKIAYLVDSYRGQTGKHDFLDFALFVSFFPQLIAGPIVHHKEMMPQFHRPEIFRPSAANLAGGLTLFAIGMFKKVIVADTVSVWADAGFAAANAGAGFTFFEAWATALSFTFQIYFDFSGYTDMALGLALMIGVRLPINFDSPYKATSIIDFWRRWHITLSRFLRDYVYISLGGNRQGAARRYVNLMLTMLIGGLWHGAAWTFVVWGGLHGAYLVVNHAWNYARDRLGLSWGVRRWHALVGLLLTFAAVVVGWVFFRAESFAAAANVLRGMFGLHGFVLASEFRDALGPVAGALESIGFIFDTEELAIPHVFNETKVGVLVILTAAVWLLPNSMQLLAHARPVLEAVRPPRIWWPFRALGETVRVMHPDGTLALGATTGVVVGWLVFGCLLYQLMRSTALQSFIYFQF
jgi:alginate O-acetyltransferase complex protein AlgI